MDAWIALCHARIIETEMRVALLRLALAQLHQLENQAETVKQDDADEPEQVPKPPERGRV